MTEKKTAVFVYQTPSQANGGLKSIANILDCMPELFAFIVTNLESRWTTDRRRRGLDIHIRDIATGLEKRFRTVRGRFIQVKCMILNNLYSYRVIRQTGCGVSHINDEIAFWNFAPGAVIAGAHVLINVRDTHQLSFLIKRLKWIFMLIICSRFVVLSREMEQHWVEELYPATQIKLLRRKIKFVYSMVNDATKLKDGYDKINNIEDYGTFKIGYIGAFSEKKGQLEFIKNAVPFILNDIPNAVLHFLGDFDPHNDNYAANCVSAVLDIKAQKSCIFNGFSLDMREWYCSLDIVVLASKHEGLARCMLESLTYGTPVISFDVCSAHEILSEHQCGIVVPEGEYAALAGAAVLLYKDPAWRDRLGENGAKVMRRICSVEQGIAAYHAMYKELTE